MIRRLLDTAFIVAVCIGLAMLTIGVWDNLQDPTACWTSC